jgi:hypothetical protein
MGIFDWLWDADDQGPAEPDQEPQSRTDKAGAGRDAAKGRVKTKTEEDLRRVQAQYNPAAGRFDPR